MPFTKLSLKDKQVLLKTARHAIQYGLLYHKAPKLELAKYSQALQTLGASFVTLKENAQLRGCIGTLVAHQALLQDVAEHAFGAAFKDHRFTPVNHIEEPLIHISISILSAPQPIIFSSEQDLLSQLNTEKDGLILEYKDHKGTFLPTVWQQLKTAEVFLNQLKIKAGLTDNFWSDDIKVSRYYCEVIE